MTIRLSRILCPVDFSQCSRDALDCAIGLARHHTARVLVLHVFANWPAVAVIPSLNADAPGKSSLRDVDRDELLRCLERFVKDRPANHVHIETTVVEAPDVHREILSQAEQQKADVIVLGSHGRSGFERLLLGSTTEKVLRKAACPVMIVPPRAVDSVSRRKPGVP
jgi:nucleotide-binding universal stress UspA family protein